MDRVAEDRLVQLAIEMITYASQHSFQGDGQETDLLGFCELNNRYSRLERRLHASSGRPPLADKWDVARNKITTYISRKVSSYPHDGRMLAEAFLMVAEPYVLSLVNQTPLRKAL